jgi:hypothetical protein
VAAKTSTRSSPGRCGHCGATHRAPRSPLSSASGTNRNLLNDFDKLRAAVTPSGGARRSSTKAAGRSSGTGGAGRSARAKSSTSPDGSRSTVRRTGSGRTSRAIHATHTGWHLPGVRSSKAPTVVRAKAIVRSDPTALDRPEYVVAVGARERRDCRTSKAVVSGGALRRLDHAYRGHAGSAAAFTNHEQRRRWCHQQKRRTD